MEIHTAKISGPKIIYLSERIVGCESTFMETCFYTKVDRQFVRFLQTLASPAAIIITVKSVVL